MFSGLQILDELVILVHQNHLRFDRLVTYLKGEDNQAGPHAAQLGPAPWTETRPDP